MDPTGTFVDDLAFLRTYAKVVVLSDSTGSASVAVVPAWQGRAMTSSAEGTMGRSFGWINRKLIESRRRLSHFNPLGGEDRVWLGPEGGQFSIFFARGAPFDLEHWFVPAAFDTRIFDIVEQSRDQITLKSSFDLRNYAGAHFDVRLERTVRVLEGPEARTALALPRIDRLALVAYESRNTLVNAGRLPWTRETGLLSIWILGMFKPSRSTTIVIPLRPGPDSELGIPATSDYFGPIPGDRINVTDRAVYLSADGAFRSKIGVNPKRSLGVLGSYDASARALTLIKFDLPVGRHDYVNSLWKMQDHPFAGDAANAYNDGPPATGFPPMGPFLELESSSPAAELAPGQKLIHTHRTFHVTGPETELDLVSRAVLDLSLADIKASLLKPGDGA